MERLDCRRPVQLHSLREDGEEVARMSAIEWIARPQFPDPARLRLCLGGMTGYTRLAEMIERAYPKGTF